VGPDGPLAGDAGQFIYNVDGDTPGGANVYYVSGDVGIGVTPPLADLDVAGEIQGDSLDIDGIVRVDKSYAGTLVILDNEYTSDVTNTTLNIDSGSLMIQDITGRYVYGAKIDTGNIDVVGLDATSSGNLYGLYISGGSVSESTIGYTATANGYGLYVSAPSGTPTNGGAYAAYFGGGNVGIGVAAPTQALDVSGTVKATDFSCSACLGTADIADVYVRNTGDAMTGALTMGNANITGVGHLTINDTGANEGLAWTGATSGWIIDVSPETRTNADGNLNLYGTSNSIILWRSTKLKGTGSNLIVEGTGNSTIAGNVIIGGKVTVDEVDPVYNIDGIAYATYGHSTTGLKEETIGKVELIKRTQGIYSYLIDFDKQEIGSDLWLFKKVSAFGGDWQDLVVMLTPEGKADVWYEFEPEENLLIIFSNKQVKVSYRLISPRFDWPKRDTNLYNGDGKVGENIGMTIE